MLRRVWISVQWICDRIQYYKIGEREKACTVVKLKTLLAKKKQVQQAWVFGSFTRRDSVRDIDVAIHAEPELSFRELLDLNAEIELELRIPVDLVEIAKVPASLKESILKNGIKMEQAKTKPDDCLL
jgi:predicted nucleotidyltransferase